MGQKRLLQIKNICDNNTNQNKEWIDVKYFKKIINPNYKILYCIKGFEFFDTKYKKTC
jgi:hypothetical protein